VRELRASLIVPRCSRYLIDLDRPSEDRPIYPSMNNTGFCPTRFFTGDLLYRDGSAPDFTEEVAEQAAEPM
jgi:N-formylglutamate deformylase